MEISFKSNLAALMELKKISIRKLSEKTGLSPETISRARDERIASCQLETLVRIARSLDCSVLELFKDF